MVSPKKYGSDSVADLMRSFGVPFLPMTPGASFRGLPDSIVNHLGNSSPELLICIPDEHAVAIAHGYATVTGEPLIVALHSNVGLMHAAMTIYNAWCDRVPMLIIGATGPLDAETQTLDRLIYESGSGADHSLLLQVGRPTDLTRRGAELHNSRNVTHQDSASCTRYINCDTVLFEEEHELANNQLIDGTYQAELPDSPKDILHN